LPSDGRKLLTIPQVGPYCAGAVLSFGFGKKAPIADSNVERIYTRVFANSLEGGKPDNSLILEVAKRLLPEKKHATFNYGILDIGGLICTHGKPSCGRCPISTFCDTGVRNLAEKPEDSSRMTPEVE
jgi:A/G-specific adenine glycosylase